MDTLASVCVLQPFILKNYFFVFTFAQDATDPTWRRECIIARICRFVSKGLVYLCDFIVIVHITFIDILIIDVEDTGSP